ncbi:MAG: DUF3343 domain-containing protein [Cyanobacteria bacterium]|nr:DUF3343 domain-containing protein [Cyanobacteriota bacterium]
MPRIILTFKTTHHLLAAEKQLKQLDSQKALVRPTPVPPGLSDSICGMALELLDRNRRQEIISLLEISDLSPEGVHELDDR